MNVAQLMTRTVNGKLAVKICKRKGIMYGTVTRQISDVIVTYEFDFPGVYK